MEEKNNLTAERSLEIITEQIERSRQIVAKDTGELLFNSSLCIIGISLLVFICLLLTGNTAFYLLFILVPAVIYGANLYVKRDRPQVPVNYVGYLVDKTWHTFGTFAILYFVLFSFHPFWTGQGSSEVLLHLNIISFRTILLMMGMTIAITGHILKKQWMVVCGICGGVVGFEWESFNMTQNLLSWLGADTSENGTAYGMIPSIIIAIFSFVGLTLPGWLLKKQS